MFWKCEHKNKLWMDVKKNFTGIDQKYSFVLNQPI